MTLTGRRPIGQGAVRLCRRLGRRGDAPGRRALHRRRRGRSRLGQGRAARSHRPRSGRLPRPRGQLGSVDWDRPVTRYRCIRSRRSIFASTIAAAAAGGGRGQLVGRRNRRGPTHAGADRGRTPTRPRSGRRARLGSPARPSRDAHPPSRSSTPTDDTLVPCAAPADAPLARRARLGPRRRRPALARRSDDRRRLRALPQAPGAARPPPGDPARRRAA